MKTRFAYLLIATWVVVSVPWAALAGKDDKQPLDRVDQWEMAAGNREMAAATQERQAEEFMAKAQEARKKEYFYDAERRANLNQAGDAEKMAGDLQAAAYLNHDKAVANWSAAVEEYRRLKDPEKEKNTRAKVDAARANALQACARASEAYEQAADAFAKDNAGEPVKEAQASERAAQYRELLAVRK